MSPDLVRLTPDESYCGKFVAHVRTSESRSLGISDRSATALMGGRNGLLWDNLGACGEIACAKWLGIEYIASVNTFHTQHDVGPFEVRTASRDSDRFILRDSDKEISHRPFMLIVKRAPCLFRIVGWAYAEGLFQDEFLTNFGIRDREPGYAIPQKMMNTDFSSFIDKTSEFKSPFRIIIPDEVFGPYMDTELGSKLGGCVERI